MEIPISILESLKVLWKGVNATFVLCALQFVSTSQHPSVCCQESDVKVGIGSQVVWVVISDYMLVLARAMEVQDSCCAAVGLSDTVT